MIRSTLILAAVCLTPSIASAALALAGDPLPAGATAVELSETVLNYHLRVSGGPVTASSDTEFTITGPWAGSFELRLLDAAVDEVAVTSIPSPALPGTLTHVVAPHPGDSPVGTTFTYMINSVSDPTPDTATLSHPGIPHFDAFVASIGVTTVGTAITSWQFDLIAAHSPEPSTFVLCGVLGAAAIGYRRRKRNQETAAATD